MVECVFNAFHNLAVLIENRFTRETDFKKEGQGDRNVNTLYSEVVYYFRY